MIEGLQGVEDAFADLADIPAEVDEQIHEKAEEVAGEVRDNVRVLTGFLQSTVEAVHRPGEHAVSIGAPYAEALDTSRGVGRDGRKFAEIVDDALDGWQPEVD